jgi:CDP-glucose 4,6-dehydratase
MKNDIDIPESPPAAYESSAVLPDPDFWRGKRVLITGHTGFKGSWLSLWLSRLGSTVIGYSLPPESMSDLFHSANVRSLIGMHHISDIRDADAIKRVVVECRPDIIIHLAAQSLVFRGYENPLLTFETNFLGTANLLDAVRGCDSVRVALVITTDKVYEDQEFMYPFRESDPLGGYDPYSSSKAASEILIASYRRSYLNGKGVAVASARAGNVIGGGDWAAHRLLPDAVRAWSNGEPLEVRHPYSTRPWQHVLEPLAAYLRLCSLMWEDPSLADAYNFGPDPSQCANVMKVLTLAKAFFPKADLRLHISSHAPREAAFLSLETTKAKGLLGIFPRWGLEEAIGRTMNWYSRYLDSANAQDLCYSDLSDFEDIKGT